MAIADELLTILHLLRIDPDTGEIREGGLDVQMIPNKG
jgi:hypothetical protein